MRPSTSSWLRGERRGADCGCCRMLIEFDEYELALLHSGSQACPQNTVSLRFSSAIALASDSGRSQVVT